MNKITSRTIKKYTFVWSILIYPAILFMIFYVGVNFNSFLLAFQKIDAVTGIRTFIKFDNFVRFFDMWKTDSLFKLSIANSLKMYFINLIISFPLTLIFAFYLFKKFRFTKTFRLIVMIPAVVSAFIMCLLFQKFVQVGLPAMLKQYFNFEMPKLMQDSRYTFGTSLFYMIWISFSTSLIVLPNAMNEISEEIIESVQLDGASYFREFWNIILPLILPTITTFIVVGISGIFSNAGPIHAFYMYSAYPEVYNVGYYLLQKTMTSQTYELYPFLAASGLVFTIIIAPVTIFVKYILEKLNP